MHDDVQTSGHIVSNPATILVVEDEPLVSSTIAEHLLQSGFEVLEAIDVEAALGLLQTRQIDVVFSDVRLPGGRTGFDLAQIVSVRWPGVRVLLASGYYEPESQVYTGLALLKKPYRLADVEQHIRLLLRRANPSEG
jgi:DNA-binding response OmpR family regulator